MLRLSKSKSSSSSPQRWPQSRLSRRDPYSFPYASKSTENANDYLVSVVIPVYNHAEFVGACIESILAERDISLECIVVNDGSTDNLAQVVEPHLKDARLKFFEKENGGISSALNLGFKKAKGEFLTWLSADNYYLSGGLKSLRNFLISNPSVSLCYANVNLIDGKARPLVESSYRPEDQAYPGSDTLMLPMEGESLAERPDNFINCAFMYRREIADSVGEYRSDLLGAEDYDYWLRLGRYGRIAHIDSEEPTAAYRLHDNSLTESLESSALVKLTRNLQTSELNYRKSPPGLSIQASEKVKDFLSCFNLEVSLDANLEATELICNGKTLDMDWLENGTSGFSKSPSFRIKSSESSSYFEGSEILEIPNLLKRARSSYYRTSEELGEKIIFAKCENNETAEFLQSLAELDGRYGFLISSSNEELNFADTRIGSKCKVFSIGDYSEPENLDALLYCLSSSDLILATSLNLDDLALGAAAGIPVYSKCPQDTDSIYPLPPQLAYADFSSPVRIAASLERQPDFSNASLDQWLSCFEIKSVKKKLLAYLKSQ